MICEICAVEKRCGKINAFHLYNGEWISTVEIVCCGAIVCADAAGSIAAASIRSWVISDSKVKNETENPS